MVTLPLTSADPIIEVTLEVDPDEVTTLHVRTGRCPPTSLVIDRVRAYTQSHLRNLVEARRLVGRRKEERERREGGEVEEEGKEERDGEGSFSLLGLPSGLWQRMKLFILGNKEGASGLSVFPPELISKIGLNFSELYFDTAGWVVPLRKLVTEFQEENICGEISKILDPEFRIPFDDILKNINDAETQREEELKILRNIIPVDPNEEDVTP
jgi:hypothetical protein